MKVVDEALGGEIFIQGEHLTGKKKIQGKPFNKVYLQNNLQERGADEGDIEDIDNGSMRETAIMKNMIESFQKRSKPYIGDYIYQGIK